MNRLFITFKTQIYKSCLKFRAKVLLLVKCSDNKMVKSPYNCAILPLTQPQVANQKKITWS